MNAGCTGLSYSVNNTTTGILITAAGYSHKLSVLVDALLDAVVAFKPLESRFQVDHPPCGVHLMIAT